MARCFKKSAKAMRDGHCHQRQGSEASARRKSKKSSFSKCACWTGTSAVFNQTGNQSF
jgi:hypothetical protein